MELIFQFALTPSITKGNGQKPLTMVMRVLSVMWFGGLSCGFGFVESFWRTAIWMM
jgi:hypothetical protein